jgi:hypothetical protein
MNEQEFDRLLATVVDEGPVQAPDYVIEGALAEIPTTRQRDLVARPWRTSMLRPIAALTSTAAVVAVVAYLAFASPGEIAVSPSPSAQPSPTPSPTPAGSPAQTTFTTSEFEVPLSIPLDRGFAGVEFDIQETPSKLTVTPVSDGSNRLIIVPLDGTEVLGGSEPRPIRSVDELASILDGRPDMTAERLEAFDTGEPASYPIAGSDAPVVDVRTAVSGGASAGPLFSTASGDTVEVPDEPTTLWIFLVEPSGKPGLLVIHAATAEDFGMWAGTFLTALENAEIDG